jgi:DNA topoisomerase-3
MKKLLSVAEKPSVAQAIAQALAVNGIRTRARRNFQGGCPIHDIKCYFQNENVDMVITSVAGHLFSTEFKSPYNKWGSCDARDLFTCPVEKIVESEGKKFCIFIYFYINNMKEDSGIN